jgi:DNA-binding transcriptional regulator LsrR (DeoR family)
MTDFFNKNEYIKIAYYYYKNGLTQQEIAQRMSMSRQRVNRILKKCLETGIVKIVIQEYENKNVEFETQLEAQLGLNEVIIADTRENAVNESIGEAGSAYLERAIKDGDVIGFSRGRALSALVARLVPTDKKDLTVTQLVGGLNAQEAHTNSDDIVRHSAEILHAKPYFMYAPIIVENKQLRDSMLNESFFSQVYNTMKKCTVAVVGIGDMSSKSAFVQRKFVSEEEYSVLKGNHVVGEICTHYFDKNGTLIDSGLNDRVFAIDCATYKKIPLRIGVAGGEDKLDAITGAVKGKMINVLITDYDTAKMLYRAP